MWKTDSTTREQHTSANYRKRYEGWRAKLAKEYGVDPEQVPSVVVAEYVVKIAGTLRISSWRQYRATVIGYMEETGMVDSAAMEVLEAETNRRRFGIKPDNEDGAPKTSSHKTKGLSGNTYALLKYRLNQIAGISRNKIALSMLETVTITGMRPIEIINATLEDDGYGQKRIVHIKNAKATNGRANGESRKMMLVNVTQEEVSSIEATINYARECRIKIESASEGKTEEEVTQETSEYIRRAFKQWFKRRICNWLRKTPDWKTIAGELELPKYGYVRERILKELNGVTLYTFRHQMFANAKAASSEGMIRPVEIAALGGHSSISTHRIHYGKRVRGQASQVKVVPTAESVANVTVKGNEATAVQIPTLPSHLRDNGKKPSQQTQPVAQEGWGEVPNGDRHTNAPRGTQDTSPDGPTTNGDK